MVQDLSVPSPQYETTVGGEDDIRGVQSVEYHMRWNAMHENISHINAELENALCIVPKEYVIPLYTLGEVGNKGFGNGGNHQA